MNLSCLSLCIDTNLYQLGESTNHPTSALTKPPGCTVTGLGSSSHRCAIFCNGKCTEEMLFVENESILPWHCVMIRFLNIALIALMFLL